MNIDAMKGAILPQSPKPVVNASATSRAAVEQTSDQAVQQAARQLEQHMLGMGTALEFSVDKETGTTVVTVRDKNSGDVIRKMPTKEALWLAQNLDKLSSSLFSASA